MIDMLEVILRNKDVIGICDDLELFVNGISKVVAIIVSDNSIDLITNEATINVNGYSYIESDEILD